MFGKGTTGGVPSTAGLPAVRGFPGPAKNVGQINVTPPPAELTLTGYAPTFARSDYSPGIVQTDMFGPVYVSAGVEVAGAAYYRSSGQLRFAPGVGALTLTGYAPTFTRGLYVRPGVGALTLTGYAPSIRRGLVFTPSTGALTLTGFAPTFARTLNQFVTPGVGALTLTGLAPTIARTAHQGFTPSVGTLALTGFAPTIARTINTLFRPSVCLLTLTGYAPTIHQSGPTYPDPGDVRLGVQYGPNETNYTGTLVTTGTGVAYLRRR